MKRLAQRGFVAFKPTTRGTVTTLRDARIYDINESDGDRQTTNARPLTRMRRKKRMKRNTLRTLTSGDLPNCFGIGLWRGSRSREAAEALRPHGTPDGRRRFGHLGLGPSDLFRASDFRIGVRAPCEANIHSREKRSEGFRKDVSGQGRLGSSGTTHAAPPRLGPPKAPLHSYGTLTLRSQCGCGSPDMVSHRLRSRGLSGTYPCVVPEYQKKQRFDGLVQKPPLTFYADHGIIQYFVSWMSQAYASEFQVGSRRVCFLSMACSLS
jgi:hypothetical protein